MLQAQVTKKTLTWDDVVSWKQITDKAVSDNGRWVFCKMAPWRGDATVYLYNEMGEEKASFQPAEGASFSSSSQFLLVTEKPALKVTEELKLKKTKEENMPMNKLVIYNLQANEKEVIDSIRSFKLSETADWLAYQRGSKADSAL